MFDRVDAALRGKSLEPAHRFHVPGRIEVLGKHTDYAGGRSLLAAVERGFCVASASRRDGVVRIVDVGRGEEVSLHPSEGGSGEPHWAIYPAAVVRRMARDFEGPFQGAEIALLSDLPPSSGLSSSSALLMATFEALRLANGLDERPSFVEALPTTLDVAAYLGSVESGRPFRNFAGEAGVGTRGGSQDHTAILASEPGRICQFGFSPLAAIGSTALPDPLVFVIAVSGVAARKAGEARERYNRAADLTAVLLEIWRSTVGGAEETLFEVCASSPRSASRLREAIPSAGAGVPRTELEARLDQFMNETFFHIPEAFAALQAGDLEALGSAVDRSQEGAERGLGNQIPETIELARLARSLGAHAASSFGAGFGGSVWALIDRTNSARFLAAWERGYGVAFQHPGAQFFPTAAGPPLLRLVG